MDTLFKYTKCRSDQDWTEDQHDTPTATTAIRSDEPCIRWHGAGGAVWSRGMTPPLSQVPGCRGLPSEKLLPESASMEQLPSLPYLTIGEDVAHRQHPMLRPPGGPTEHPC